MSDTDERFMREALSLAHEAAAGGDVPVGAIIVRREGDTDPEKIIARGENRTVRHQDATGHAEVVAIREVATDANVGVRDHT